MPLSRFETIRAGGWIIRPMSPGDAAPLWRRRNDPDTARFQDWITPYPLEAAEQLVADVVALDGAPPAGAEMHPDNHASARVAERIGLPTSWASSTPAQVGLTNSFGPTTRTRNALPGPIGRPVPTTSPVQ